MFNDRILSLHLCPVMWGLPCPSHAPLVDCVQWTPTDESGSGQLQLHEQFIFCSSSNALMRSLGSPCPFYHILKSIKAQNNMSRPGVTSVNRSTGKDDQTLLEAYCRLLSPLQNWRQN